MWLYKRIKINNRWVLEHRHLMELFLGRKLNKNEEVHHIDGDPTNNSFNNLKLETDSTHCSLHHPKKAGVECKCLNCGLKYSLVQRRYRYKIKHGEKFFCSRKCIAVYCFSKFWARSDNG